MTRPVRDSMHSDVRAVLAFLAVGCLIVASFLGVVIWAAAVALRWALS